MGKSANAKTRKHDKNTQLFVALVAARGKLERAKLARRPYWESRVRELESELVTANDGLAVYAANKFGTVHDLDVSLAEARFILLRCVRCFNPALGCKFATYYVTSALRRFMQLREVASRQFVPFSVVGRLRERGDKCQRPIEGFYEPDFDRSFDLQALRETLASDVLTDRERKVLLGRYWDNRTLEDVGATVGLTRERVRQIQMRALAKLREAMGCPSETLSRLTGTRSSRRS
jgi:RNA polymerase sigma factor (sigma-70 family)